MEWWEILAKFGPFVGALATVGLAWLALRQLQALRKQVGQGQEQVRQGQANVVAGQRSAQAAEQSAEAAIAAVRASSRARIDQEAPRVVALFESPQWPPLVDATRSVVQGGQPSHLDALGQSYVVEANNEFIFPAESGYAMWFRMRGILVNEGKATANVHLDRLARFIEGASPLLGGAHVAVPPQVGCPGEHQYALRSGETALFEWGAGKPLKDWACARMQYSADNPSGICWLDITVTSFDASVVDKIYVSLRAAPIERVPNRDGHWKLLDHSSDVHVSSASRRAYRIEGNDLPADPRAELGLKWEGRQS